MPKGQRRQFSVEQKLSILDEAEQFGLTQTLRKHNLSHSVFLRWKNQFKPAGGSSLQAQYHKVDPQAKALEDENARLKKIIANQALELEFRTELLNKSNVPFPKR